MRVIFESVERTDQDGVDAWVVAVSHVFDKGEPIRGLGGVAEQDGEKHPHKIYMPADTLEWRAAEYGIDPADKHTLWDLVMAEAYMTPEDYAEEPHLYGHPNRQVSRDAHLARAARVKWRHRISTRTDHPVHNTVKAESPMHPEALFLKAQHVHLAHKSHMVQLARKSVGDSDRIERLRRTLRGNAPEFPKVEGSL